MGHKIKKKKKEKKKLRSKISHENFNLIEYFKKFTFIDTYLWLTTSSIHPNNHKYFIRYEYLVHSLLSIPKNKFSSKSITEDEFRILIRQFEKQVTFFYEFEDVEYIEQSEMIPVFLEKQKYYFFYGLTNDKSYQYNLQIIDFLSSENLSLKKFKKHFIDSLKFQTEILSKFKNDSVYEDKGNNQKMFIPSKSYFESYSNLFKVKSISIDKSYIHKNKNYNIEINNFNGLYIQEGNNYFYLPPQNHIEIFYFSLNNFIKRTPKSLNDINLSYTQRLKKIIFQFFGFDTSILTFLKKEDNSIITNFFENIVVFENKIILFKEVKHDIKFYETNSNIGIFEQNESQLSKIINLTFKESLNELNKIKSEKVIGFLPENNERPYGMFTKDINFKIVLVYETTNINYFINFSEEFTNDKDFILINLYELKSIFEILGKERKSFWEYIEFNNSNNFSNSTTLDKFLYFYKNKDSLISNYDKIFISLYFWDEFYHKFLTKKYNDNIYELMNLSPLNLEVFNLLEPTSYKNIYRVFDNLRSQESILIKIGNNIIQLLYPSYNIFNNQDEINTLNVFSESIAYYLEEIISGDNLLIKNDLLIKISEIKLLKEYRNATPISSKINKENPFFVLKTRDEIHIFYNSEYLTDFYMIDNINNEKVIIIKVLTEIFTKDIADLSIKKNSHLFEGRKFAFRDIITFNPLLKNYSPPYRKKDEYIGQVNKELESFLKENYKIGKYEGHEAKGLNNKISSFLQEKLENKVRKFNKDILLNTYQQIEFIEGWREYNVNQAVLDSSKDTDFNVMEKHEHEREEFNQLSIAAKHILHTILKVNPQGNITNNKDDWSYLLALSIIINETLYLSDSFHCSLINSKITITEGYKLKDKVSDKKINRGSFNSAIAQQQVNSMKSFMNKKKKKNEKKENNIFPIDNELKLAFNEEYGFHIEDMLRVLIFISGSDFEKYRTTFPLHILSKEKLNNIIIEYINNPNLKAREIYKIIDFLSIEYSSLSNYNIGDFSLDKMYRNPNRINIKPLIKFSDKILFGNQQVFNSYKLWFDYLLRADLPYIPDEKSIIKKAMKIVHRKLDNKLEKKAYELASKVLGKKNLLLNFKKTKIVSLELPNMDSSGEIDLLAINKERKIVFVLDAKNINRKLYPSGIKSELNIFFEKKKSYLSKLRKKSKYVKDNLEIFLDYFEIEDKNQWQVIDGFIVDGILFSEFYNNKEVDFIDIDNLQDYLIKG